MKHPLPIELCIRHTPTFEYYIPTTKYVYIYTGLVKVCLDQSMHTVKNLIKHKSQVTGPHTTANYTDGLYKRYTNFL